MIEFDQLKQYVNKKLEEEGKRKSATFTSSSIDKALENASVELNLPVEKLDYEILEKGSPGILGLGKKDWIILAYASIVDARMQLGARQILKENGIFSSNSSNIDGEIFVHIEKTGLMLKVTKPKKNGLPASFERAMSMLKERMSDTFIDTKLVKKVVESSSGEFIKIAKIDHNPVNDATVSYDITDDEMEATITLMPPSIGGIDLDAAYIKKFLKINGISNGIDENQLQLIEDNPVFGIHIVIAKGRPAKNGDDGKIDYVFDSQNKIKFKEVGGKVNFKELNKINNVIEGSVVARILPPSKGEPGYTVTGKYLDSTDGKETEIVLGNNVKISEDGLSIVATINGQVNILNGRVNVDPVYVVEGNVDLKTGNITFLGNIIVKGNIEDGFIVKSSSSVEVYGHVGKSVIEAIGDIVIHQGISGKEDICVKCEGDFFSKFIENANLDVGGNVYATDGILNSTILCGKKVLCKGKKATIVGGNITACQEISAKNIGSPAGTETIIKAGIDPKAKKRVDELRVLTVDLHNELGDLNHSYSLLASAIKENKSLSPEKAKQLNDYRKRIKNIKIEIPKVDEEITQYNERIKEISDLGQISASNIIYPSVIVFLRDLEFPIKNDFKATTFFINAKDNIIETKKYVDDGIDLGKQFEKSK